MKYNEGLFNVSEKLVSKTNIDIIYREVESEEEIRVQKLLIILMQRAVKKLQGTEELNGILKTRFISRFWSKTDDGYIEVRELVRRGWFDHQASEYGIYLGNINFGNDDEYIEILWDYKTYFETLKLNESISSTKSEEEIDKLPLEYIRERLKQFKRSVEEARKRKTSEICLEKGHKFGEWIHNEWPGYKVLHENWCRVCERCGTFEEVTEEPEKFKTLARIKELEEELSKLKKER